MFGWWYVFFVVFALAIVSLMLIPKASKNAEMWLDNWRKSKFDTPREVLDMYSNMHDTWDDIHTGVIASAVCSGVVSLILLLVCILVPIDTKKKVAYFEQQSVYVECAVKNGTDLENFAITQTIIAQNEWLAEAKASLSVYGVFSSYYNSGVEKLEPIIIKR